MNLLCMLRENETTTNMTFEKTMKTTDGSIIFKHSHEDGYKICLTETT